ncbi:MAG: GHKL domain-containing protein, partial [Clostridia bacterium]|nr:GHKL domain-containing protein [Clostridia bacterium]
PHGYGLMNIERIIREHQGSVSYKTDNDVFSMIWMVPLETA